MPSQTAFQCDCGGRITFLKAEDSMGNFYRCEMEGVRAAKLGAFISANGNLYGEF